MAVTGKFVGDFESFKTAVDQSTVKLSQFALGASKVGPALNRMADSFSGQKIQKEAALMEKAIGGIEGVARLTEAEMRRVNATMTEAIEKFKALGKTAPPGMTQLADATKGAGQQTSFLATGIGKLATVFTLAKVGMFVTDLVASAGALQDMHERTDISVEALQRFKVISEQSGSSLDAVAGAAFQLSRRLGEGSESTVGAVTALGLSYRDLMAMNPEQRFQIVGAALGDVADSANRSKLGTDLFARSVDDLVPTLKHLNDETGSYVEMSADQIKAIDWAGDAWVRMKASLIPVTVALIDNTFQLSNSIAILRGLVGAVDAVAAADVKATERLQLYNKSVADRAAKALHGAELDAVAKAAIEELNTSLAENKKHVDGAAAATKKAGDEAATAAKALRDFHNAIGVQFIADVGSAAKATEDAAAAMRKFNNEIGVQEIRDIELMNAETEKTAAAMRALNNELGVIAQNQAADALKFVGPVLDDLSLKAKTFGQTITESLGQLPDLLVKAFTGGGGVGGALNALGASISKDLFGKGGALSGALAAAEGGLKDMFGKTLGSAFSAAIPGIGALIGPGLQLLWGGIKKLFGGPSKEELQARGETGGFQKELDAIATASQRAEAATAGWAGALDVIVVRDAYAKLGKSAEEAQRDVAAVWNDKDQAGHQAALGRINAALAEQDDLAKASGDAAAIASKAATDAATAQAAAFQKDLDALFSKRDSLMETIKGEAPEDVMGVIEAQTRGQIGALDREIEQQQHAMEEAAREIADKFEKIFKELKIFIPIEFEYKDPDPTRGGGGGESEGFRFVPFTSPSAKAAAARRAAEPLVIITKTYLEGREIAQALTKVHV